MTPRERILAVYRGETPDVVPFMLDLSHWFCHRFGRPWDLSSPFTEPALDLIDYHKRAGVGFYVPNISAFYEADFPADVHVETRKRTADGSPEIVWRIETPFGAIERARVWHENTYAWAVSRWGIMDEKDLAVFRYAMSRRRFRPRWERYDAWAECVGDIGVVYLSAGYSTMGHLLGLWMGVEAVVYASVDYPSTLRETVEAVNANTLDLVDLLCESPAEIIMMGDNISSDVQSPPFFNTWSKPFYSEAVKRLHAAGKYVAVHIDGKLRGAIDMVKATGADCGDAITPAPMGDLTAAQCRAEAGTDFILSGGVSPELWLPTVPIEAFDAAAQAWLEQKKNTFRFIANAGDQVPPGADEARIRRMRDLVEEYGRYH